jgi:hypothetical protein
MTTADLLWVCIGGPVVFYLLVTAGLIIADSYIGNRWPESWIGKNMAAKTDDDPGFYFFWPLLLVLGMPFFFYFGAVHIAEIVGERAKRERELELGRRQKQVEMDKTHPLHEEHERILDI